MTHYHRRFLTKIDNDAEDPNIIVVFSKSGSDYQICSSVKYTNTGPFVLNIRYQAILGPNKEYGKGLISLSLNS